MAAWQDFRTRYENEWVSHLRVTTGRGIRSALNKVEQLCSPRTTDDIDLDKFFRSLSRQNISRDSAVTYCKRISEATEWGRRRKLCASRAALPDIPKNRERKLPPRPMTQEQINQQIATATQAGADVLFLIRGLLASGMRIEEAELLKWSSGPFVPLLDHDPPMFEVDARYDKAGMDRMLPMTQEFYELLLSVPEQRQGYVFLPKEDRAKLRRIVASVGKMSGVTMKTAPKVKYPTAHDYRRTFASRWALKVPPHVLQLLMRHEDIQTTLRYYVRVRALEVAKSIQGMKAFTAELQSSSTASGENKA